MLMEQSPRRGFQGSRAWWASGSKTLASTQLFAAGQSVCLRRPAALAVAHNNLFQHSDEPCEALTRLETITQSSA